MSVARPGRRCRSGPEIPAITWWCHCGEHGFTTSQPAAARQLTEHLTSSGHRRGEYSYGCAGQRTVVAVRAVEGAVEHVIAP